MGDMKQKMKDNAKAINCKCGNKWLTPVPISKFDGSMTVTLGQKLTSISETFIAYQCPKCGDFTLPRVHLTTQDSIRKDYDDMYDSLTAPVETGDDR